MNLILQFHSMKDVFETLERVLVNIGIEKNLSSTFVSLWGWGALKICFGVWPNSLIWAIIDAFSTGSLISSILTAPS